LTSSEAKMRLGSSSGLLSDLLQLVAHLVLFWLTALVVWVWSKAGVPWEVAASGYVAAFFGLVLISLLCIEHALKLFRRVRAEWRRTFRR
jgi:hypothetical protein